MTFHNKNMPKHRNRNKKDTLLLLYRRPWSAVCLITGRVSAVLESDMMSLGALEGVSSKAKLSTPGKKTW